MKSNLTTLSATEAQRTLADVLNRVEYRGERFMIVRNGRPIGELGPARPVRFTVREWVAWLSDADRPRPDSGWADDAEAGYRALNEERVPTSPWDDAPGEEKV